MRPCHARDAAADRRRMAIGHPACPSPAASKRSSTCSRYSYRDGSSRDRWTQDSCSRYHMSHATGIGPLPPLVAQCGDAIRKCLGGNQSENLHPRHGGRCRGVRGSDGGLRRRERRGITDHRDHGRGRHRHGGIGLSRRAARAADRCARRGRDRSRMCRGGGADPRGPRILPAAHRCSVPDHHRVPGVGGWYGVR